MKKESFQGLLCIIAGIMIAAFIFGCMFRNLHWPGGMWLLAVITPCLLAIQSLCLSCYVAKHGKLAQCDKPAAKHLRRIGSAAFVALAFLAIAIIFRANHWPAGAQLVLISCSTLAILSFLAGIFGCKLLNSK